ncbi:hypothetical protein BGZ63DRAFT_364416 [Mariannaea sp. PMI_226]|nr:hypothetical protein BGZ63DRAFT_364416 [Mariannaea sp. PMI_226]
MQRDARRGRGQWSGCHTFRDIVCDDTAGPATPYKRHGGLKMGHTYYYYYEVNGSVETHNPELPSTTACPYMPGQTVNTLIVPVEQALRNRSASLNSLHTTDFKSMDPQSRFITPRPAPFAQVENPPFRLGSSPLLNHKTSARSLSPAPAWKRFFTRKITSRDGERGRSPEPWVRNTGTSDEADGRCTTPSEGTRTRDLSPESLRRFLSDDTPSRPGSNLSVRPTLVIPDDIAEDQEQDNDNDNDNDNDDDDNFATSAVSEIQAYPTRLSPPPFRRAVSCGSGPSANKPSAIIVPTKASTLPLYQTEEVPASAVLPSHPKLEVLTGIPSTGYFASPVSQYPDDDSQAYCYDLTDDEDDLLSSNNSDILSGQPTVDLSKIESYECYSLPVHEQSGRKIAEPKPSYAKMNTPLLSERRSDVAVDGSNFLGSPVNHGLDDFANELGWMADIIESKRH